MKKRILALVMCLALMVCALPVQAVDGDAYTRASFSMDFVDALGLEYTEDMAQELSDVSPDHEAYEAICIMLYHGQLVNHSGNSFRPDGNISRGDAAVVLARALGLENYSTDSLPADVPSTRYYA